MRQALLLVTLLVLTLASFGHAGPVDGTRGFYETLDRAVTGPDNDLQPGRYMTSKTFRGGERACVMVIGDHQPTVDLTILVYDKDNQIVARDTGRGGVGDFVAAIWYPVRTEAYRIEVQSPGPDVNKCYIAIK